MQVYTGIYYHAQVDPKTHKTFIDIHFFPCTFFSLTNNLWAFFCALLYLVSPALFL